MNYLLPTRLADQRGLNPTLSWAPAHTHTQIHTPRPACHSCWGDTALTQGVVCGWQRKRLTRPPRAGLPERSRPDLDQMPKPIPLKKPSLGKPQKPFRTSFSHLAFPYLIAPGTLRSASPSFTSAQHTGRPPPLARAEKMLQRKERLQPSHLQSWRHCNRCPHHVPIPAGEAGNSAVLCEL